MIYRDYVYFNTFCYLLLLLTLWLVRLLDTLIFAILVVSFTGNAYAVYWTLDKRGLLDTE